LGGRFCLGRDGAGDPPERQPTISQVFGNPISGGGSAWGTGLSPSLVECNGDPLKDAQHGHRIGLAHSALVLLPSDIQDIMGSVFNAPALTLQGQPELRAELLGGQGAGQPGAAQSAFGPDAPIYACNLQCSRQAQFLGLDGASDDGSVLRSPFTGLGRVVLRGERSPAGASERFGAGSVDCPAG